MKQSQEGNEHEKKFDSTVSADSCPHQGLALRHGAKHHQARAELELFLLIQLKGINKAWNTTQVCTLHKYVLQ
jgi:hypothetical protein